MGGLRAKDNDFMTRYAAIKRDVRPSKNGVAISYYSTTDDQLSDAEAWALVMQLRGALAGVNFTADEKTRDKSKQTALITLSTLAAVSNVVPVYGQMASATFALAAFIVGMAVKDKAPYTTKAEFDKAINNYIDVVSSALKKIDTSDVRNVYPAILLLAESGTVLRDFMVKLDESNAKDKGQKVVVKTDWWEAALKRFRDMAKPYETLLLSFNQKQLPALADWKRKLYALSQNQSAANIQAAQTALNNVLRTNVSAVSPSFISKELLNGSYMVLEQGFNPATIVDAPTATGRTGDPRISSDIKARYDQLLKPVLAGLPKNTTFGGGVSDVNPLPTQADLNNTVSGVKNKLSAQVKIVNNVPVVTTGQNNTPSEMIVNPTHSEANVKVAEAGFTDKIKAWVAENKAMAIVAVVLVVGIIVYFVLKAKKK